MEIKEKKVEKLVEEMVQSIENDFDKMNRVVNNPTLVDRYLIASTLKAMRFTDAIKVLCSAGYTDESLPILRSLIEHSINMRWILNKNTSERLKKYMNDLGKKGFGAAWTEESLLSRMEEIGFNRDYYDFCVKPTYSYSHVNSSSLSWGEVFEHPQLKGERFKSEAIFQVVAQMIGHVMKSLNTRFDNYFKDYDYFWKQIKVDKDIREKVEAALKQISLKE